MQETSDTDLGPHVGRREVQVPRVDSILFNRRQFLRGGALAVAGVAALSGVDPLRPHPALAQYQQPNASPVSNLLLLSTSATRNEGEQFCQQVDLLTGRHAYRFDYRYGLGNPPTIPNDLVATYRDGLCDVDNQLEPVVRQTPFKTPDAVPAEYPPAPPMNGAAQVACYRLVQLLDDQQTLRVFEWCSFYCGQGSTMIVQVGGPSGHIQYNPQDPGIGPPVVVNLVNSFPGIHFASFLPSGNPDRSIGPRYFDADNRQQGFSAETLWTVNLPIRSRQPIRVDASIPGSADPATRTAQARYEVTHADGTTVVQVDQRTATTISVTLGEFEFENGLASVHLTNETGEPTGTTEVVADSIRWSNA
jgi:hypothetical protein